jgi:tetratricopeptide (TPR) repeat protein
MRKDSLAFALSGTVFGLLVGWMIGAQQVPDATAPAAVPVAQADQGQATAPPPLDQARVTQLEAQAKAEPGNAGVRIDLGNLYLDAERFADAAPWYEAALAIDPKNADVTTDLGVTYFYQREFDRALATFDRALAINPDHVKALLNQGIVRSMGKQDLLGAAESWEKVVALAPASEEARLARMGLEGIRSVQQSVQSGASAQ